ncbi:hypothetical protein HBI56_084230 [Parastagonospora nodorum]|uniref:Uncharacterized protein n=1 Tax=Phaeosphaeria nodorum (strain SN15 / ATCC MYA-4574 / FGSC 10173) TaxID=321614 RepID=A0A7U2I883_PHANO|nr:hypothetical protein HBH56_102320 [Parastagonospora nodorum]QRD04522.1 hypothetical protein JI435_104630 [Parastagonospora nodorum SN15]KAH3929437.1 hypothetical protein HBH54_128090 [Parastagonospora nodorum]KAH3951551.1 hypothetical protein HBH53_062100 [Parastagonospora nodorum]KAH3978680.1 hypothetical protein HBH51_061710 [Parastagonospora nodorum]
MLTREGFVAADMNGPNSLQRSSWKAEAIRKGNLKISGPIPIMEDTPLNEDEEKEFAETGALSPSHPQDQDGQPDIRPQTPPQPGHAPPSVPIDRGSLTSHPVDEEVQEVLQARQSRSPPRPRQVTEMARESVIEPTTPSRNTFRATPDSTTKSAQKKKRKSGLRSVFRKMFGRKDRDEPEEEETMHRGHSYHHSDPGMLQQSPPRETKTPGGTRISDLPVKELKPLHPLGQHLPYPMNVNAPPVSPPKEYLTFDVERPDIGRRRATLPSVPSAGIQRHSLDEPRGRLSAWDERPDEETLPSPGIGIGIALSSPTQATSMANKRRSRSADALRDLVRESASMDRRRSAEIRYWRQSHASGSIYSRPQTARTVETIRSIQRQETRITQSGDGIAEMSATISHVDEPSPLPIEADQVREVEPPVSAFNFGLKSGFSDDATTTSEAPAPVSPPERSKNRLSIEDRVAHLEGTFQSIESSLKRMSSRNNRQTIILSDAPRNLRSRQRSSSTSHTNFDSLPNYQSSNDTLKSNPASPTLVRPNTNEGSKEQVVEKLYEALKYERTARKALEQQVHNLQQDIADLHALVNKLIASATATSPSYPTPSPDTLIVSREDRLVTPKAEYRGKENFVRMNSKDSMRRGEEDDWKESPHDVWATPKEEGFSGSGFFGQDGRGYA